MSCKYPFPDSIATARTRESENGKITSTRLDDPSMIHPPYFYFWRDLMWEESGGEQKRERERSMYNLKAEVIECL